MAKRPGAFGIPRELPVAAAVAAAALPLSRLFQPGGFAGVALSAVVLSALIAWIARKLRLPAALSLLMSLAGLLWFAAGRFYPDTLWAGIFPSGSSMHAIIDGVQAGVRQTIDEAVPVIASAPLLMFVSAGVWLTMWLADAAAVWVGNPLLAIATTIPLFATPGTLLPSGRRWLDTSFYVAAAAWLLYSDERWRARRWRTHDAPRIGWRPGPALRLGLLGIVVVAVAAPLLPGWGAQPLLQRSGPGTRLAFNPFVAIQPTLRRQPTIALFQVRTARPTYFRLTALDHFDGKVWTQRSGRSLVTIDQTQFPPSAPKAPGSFITQRVTILGLAGQWIPASFDPVQVEGVSGVRLEDQTRGLVISTSRGFEQGTQYSVLSRIPDLTAADLDKGFTYNTSTLGDFLELPSNLPRQVRDIAERVAGAKPTPFQKALALQEFLRTFTYDENVAAGHSFSDIVEFLTSTKRGYCEQFAGSMAVMARALGIPSRVAIGFGLGVRHGDVITETTREAHAWVEVFFPDAGWVAFEPTPRAGVASVPSYATPPISPLPSGSAGPSASASAGASPSAVPSGRLPQEPVGPESATGRPVWVVFAAIAAAVVALALAGVATTLVMRMTRRRRAHGKQSAVVVRYLEFLDWCAAAGFGRHRGETPIEHAGRLAALATDAEESLSRLAELAGEALWAPPNGLDPAEVSAAVADARACLREKVSRRRRLLAATGWGLWREAD